MPRSWQVNSMKMNKRYRF